MKICCIGVISYLFSLGKYKTEVFKTLLHKKFRGMEKVKLQIDLKVDFDDYQIAKSLYEQSELVHEESQGNQEKEGESGVRKIPGGYPLILIGE